MKTVFADTLYWVALADPGDAWHLPAMQARRALGPVHLVTTDEVLTEFLTMFSAGGPWLRSRAARAVELILEDPAASVVPQSHQSFLEGLALYRERPDKGYSLTDCVSMGVMRTRGIAEVLTNDRHFEQEGYTVLIRR